MLLDTGCHCWLVQQCSSKSTTYGEFPLYAFALNQVKREQLRLGATLASDAQGRLISSLTRPPTRQTATLLSWPRCVLTVEPTAPIQGPNGHLARHPRTGTMPVLLLVSFNQTDSRDVCPTLVAQLASPYLCNGARRIETASWHKSPPGQAPRGSSEQA